jgi:S-adenosylmethionine:tRNA ribosyltransferase-isomerase
MIDDKFYDIVNYLNKGDVLVLNDTKVMPARLIGEKEDTGAVIEVLLLKNINEDNWYGLELVPVPALILSSEFR